MPRIDRARSRRQAGGDVPRAGAVDLAPGDAAGAAQFRQELADLAVMAAGRIVSKELDPAAQSRLIEEALAETAPAFDEERRPGQPSGRREQQRGTRCGETIRSGPAQSGEGTRHARCVARGPRQLSVLMSDPRMATFLPAPNRRRKKRAVLEPALVDNGQPEDKNLARLLLERDRLMICRNLRALRGRCSGRARHRRR